MSDSILTLPIGQYETTQSCPLGSQVYDGMNNRFRYVKFLDAVTYVRGHVTQPASTSGYFYVTNDVAGGTGDVLRFAGALPYYMSDGTTSASVPTQNQFGWVMCDGTHPAIKTNGDDDITVGMTLIMVATDGVVDSVAAATTTGTLLYVGVATTSDVDASDTVAGRIKCPLW